MNEFYGFEFELFNDKLSDSIVVSDELINTISEDKYSVGDIPIVVKCTFCNQYMRLNGKIPGKAEIGEFVCERCGNRIPQLHVFKKLSEEVRLGVTG